eukprot:3708082-Pyramimonas_sp.AAC.1
MPGPRGGAALAARAIASTPDPESFILHVARRRSARCGGVARGKSSGLTWVSTLCSVWEMSQYLCEKMGGRAFHEGAVHAPE